MTRLNQDCENVLSICLGQRTQGVLTAVTLQKTPKSDKRNLASTQRFRLAARHAETLGS